MEKWFHIFDRFADNEDAGSEHEHGGGGGHAHSFHHFSGPVVGHHEEITWKDKHGHLHHDYRAHPKYKFAYGVDDKHTKDYHGQKEQRDGTRLAIIRNSDRARRRENDGRRDIISGNKAFC